MTRHQHGLQSASKGVLSSLGLLAGLLLLPLAMLCGTPASAAEMRDAHDHFFQLNTGDLRAEAADAKKAGHKAILFMYEQEGCAGCIYMKKNVLSRVDVQTYFRREFTNFSIDIHGAVPIRDFSGRDHTEKSFAQAQAVRGTPTFAFHDLDGREIVRIVGPIKDVSEFLLLGQFVASGAYKSRKFAEYKSSTFKR
jgi:thioredoxin-related protein